MDEFTCFCPDLLDSQGATVDANGQSIRLYRCQRHRLCTLEPFEAQARTTAIRSCRTCPDLPPGCLVREPEDTVDVEGVASIVSVVDDDTAICMMPKPSLPERGPPPAFGSFDHRATAKLVSVIVPMYRSDKAVLRQIRAYGTSAEDLLVERIFVDDDCPNGSYMAALSAAPTATFVNRKVNGGFAAACNSGARCATGKYLVFLNADTIVEPGWIEPLVSRLESDPKAGAVGPMIVKPDGETIDSLGSRWGWEEGAFLHIGGWRLKERGEPLSARREMLTGCCLAVRTSAFWEVGGLDERYKVGYWEDADLCLRLREAGYDLWIEPRSRIVHEGQHAGTQCHPQAQLNRRRFHERWVKPRIIERFVSRRRRRPKPLERVLFRRMGAMGDVLVASATLAPFKAMHPEAKIDFETACPEVVAGHPMIEAIVKPGESQSEQYDCTIDLDEAYERTPYQNALTCFARAAGVDASACRFFVPRIEANLPKPYVAIHAGPGGGHWVGRNWPRQRFIELRHRIEAISVKTAWMESGSCRSVAEIAGIIAGAALFVGIDSFPFHVAQACNTPAVVVFGSVRPHVHVYRSNVVPVRVDGLSCLGCHHDSPAPSTGTNVCRVGGEPCLELLTVDRVWKEVQRAIECFAPLAKC
ncbi:MAG: glycosyltransferase [Candidatus Dormibacteria bacterium]